MILKLIKKTAIIGLVVVLLAFGLLLFQLISFQQETLNLSSEDQTFTIKSGSSIKAIAQQLSQEAIIDDPWLFILMARLKDVDTKIRAGEYRLETNFTTTKLLEKFTSGVSIQYSFTIIEGWSFRQMVNALHKDPILVKTLEDKSNAEIMAALGYPDRHPEGLFFPDTYSFPKGTTDHSFLKRAYQQMEKHLAYQWENRGEEIAVKTPYETLILASIVEKETGVAFERPLIAGVFTQRLKIGMKLQTDPTVIYGMGDEFDGDIRYRDLRKDTPYNTYVHRGLPPTPIALPGVDAIKAVLNPEKTKALFFVSKGDGTHQFSETLDAHNRAVIKYQLKGRKPKRKATSGAS